MDPLEVAKSDWKVSQVLGPEWPESLPAWSDADWDTSWFTIPTLDGDQV